MRSLALLNPDLRDRLHSATRAAFARLTNIAIEEQAAAFLIAGDLFDGQNRSVKTLLFLRAEFRRLAESDIPVYYIKGNHDAENPLLNDVSFPDNVHIFSARGESFQLAQNAPDGRPIYLHGVSFAGKTAPNLLGKYPQPVAGAVNIGLMHTSLNGAAGHDAYAPCSAAQLAAHGYEYWALGHIHKRAVYEERGSLIIMPGCPQGRDIGEDGAKSASMLCIGADGRLSAEERPSAEIIFSRLQVSARGVENTDELARNIAAQAKAAADATLKNQAAQNCIIRAELSGASPLYWQIIRRQAELRADLAAELGQTGYIWAEKLALNITAAQTAAGGADIADLPLAEAAAGLPQQDILNAVRAMADALPRAEKYAFCPDEEAEAHLAESLLNDGRAAIEALMRSEDTREEG